MVNKCKRLDDATGQWVDALGCVDSLEEWVTIAVEHAFTIKSDDKEYFDTIKELYFTNGGIEFYERILVGWNFRDRKGIEVAAIKNDTVAFKNPYGDKLEDRFKVKFLIPLLLSNRSSAIRDAGQFTNSKKVVAEVIVEGTLNPDLVLMRDAAIGNARKKRQYKSKISAIKIHNLQYFLENNKDYQLQ
jgi:hypothetical protein